MADENHHFSLTTIWDNIFGTFSKHQTNKQANLSGQDEEETIRFTPKKSKFLKTGTTKLQDLAPSPRLFDIGEAFYLAKGKWQPNDNTPLASRSCVENSGPCGFWVIIRHGTLVIGLRKMESTPESPSFVCSVGDFGRIRSHGKSP